MPERVPNPGLFRAVMAGLGGVQTLDGLYALLAPRSFYADFPFGRGWVAALPGYSEHLVRDVGGLFLATGVLLLVAAVRLERRLVVVSLVAWLLFAVPHAAFHLFNLEPYSTADAIGNALSLALTVALPGALLVLLARPAPALRPAAANPPRDSRARIRGVERPSNPLVRYAFRSSRRRLGRVVEPVAVTAHHPSLLLGYGAFELVTERADRVDERTKLLAVLKAAQLSGCEWCLDFGSAEGRAKGIADEDLRALLDHRESDRFSPTEKLVLDYAVGVTRTPVDVPDALFAALRERFDEAQLVELTSVIALENYRSRFNWAFGIEGEGFSEGAYCVRPEQPVGTAAGPTPPPSSG